MSATKSASGEETTEASGSSSEENRPSTPTMRAAREPVGTGASPLVAQLLALALAGLGVVGVQEAVVRSGLWDARSWTSATVDFLDDRTAPDWLVVPAAALLLLAVWLVVIALRRRPRKTIGLDARTGVYLRTADLARIATATIEGLDGATETEVTTTRRRLLVRVTSIAGKDQNSSIETEARSRLAPMLDALDHAPRVKIAIKNRKLS